MEGKQSRQNVAKKKVLFSFCHLQTVHSACSIADICRAQRADVDIFKKVWQMAKINHFVQFSHRIVGQFSTEFYTTKIILITSFLMYFVGIEIHSTYIYTSIKKKHCSFILSVKE